MHQIFNETQTCLNWHYLPAQLISTHNFGQRVAVENTGKVLRPIQLTHLRLIRQISQYTQKISPLKAPAYPRLLLDTRAIQFQSAQTSQKHAHWLSVTTLTKGQRVKVPVLLHDYAKQAGSDFNGSVELLFRDKAFLLSQGVNGKRRFIAEPVGLALLTDELKRVTSFQ